MCRSLRVLCAASSRERLAELKRAAVAAEWELVGGSTSVEGLAEDVRAWEPDVVVVVGLGPAAFSEVKALRRMARVIAVGDGEAADAVVETMDQVRSAILGLPRPGGPVRR